MIYVIQLEKNKRIPEAVAHLVSDNLTGQLEADRVPEFESLADETVFSFQLLQGEDPERVPEDIIVSLRENDMVPGALMYSI